VNRVVEAVGVLLGRRTAVETLAREELTRRDEQMAAASMKQLHQEIAAPDYECAECGCGDFTPGGHTVRVSRAGARVHGEVLTCLGCGARWYNTGRGLKHPHESALPPAWAMMDLQGRAAKAQTDAQLVRQERLVKAQQHAAAGPTAGFRKPPAPEQG
jgi:hypothetical protein